MEFGGIIAHSLFLTLSLGGSLWTLSHLIFLGLGLWIGWWGNLFLWPYEKPVLNLMQRWWTFAKILSCFFFWFLIPSSIALSCALSLSLCLSLALSQTCVVIHRLFFLMKIAKCQLWFDVHGSEHGQLSCQSHFIAPLPAGDPFLSLYSVM